MLEGFASGDLFASKSAGSSKKSNNESDVGFAGPILSQIPKRSSRFDRNFSFVSTNLSAAFVAEPSSSGRSTEIGFSSLGGSLSSYSSCNVNEIGIGIGK